MCSIDPVKVIGNYITLKKQTRINNDAWIGLCPFHRENTPSFRVTRSLASFLCHGCGTRGNVIKFVSMWTGINYHEVALLLAKEYKISIASGKTKKTGKRIRDRLKARKKSERNRRREKVIQSEGDNQRTEIMWRAVAEIDGVDDDITF
jgi:DNA primase